MLGIIKKLKTSIKYRLIIEFGIILIAICIFNYFLQSYIYKEVLDKKQVTNSENITRAASHQVEFVMRNYEIMLNNMMQTNVFSDDTTTNEEKIKDIVKYSEAFDDLMIIDLNGIGVSLKDGVVDVRGIGLFDRALKGNVDHFDIIQDEESAYIAILNPIGNKNGELKGLLVGVNKIESFFKQVKQISNSEVIYFTNSDGRVIAYSVDEDNIGKVEFLQNVYSIKESFSEEILSNKQYVKEIEDKYSNDKYELAYGRISQSKWILGMINKKNDTRVEFKQFQQALIIGICGSVFIGIGLIYISANALAKRMLHIAKYLGGTIENEFKEPMPLELLEKEDELGIIAREMKRLETEVVAMLDSIKETIDYLNDQVQDEDVDQDKMGRESV